MLGCIARLGAVGNLRFFLLYALMEQILTLGGVGTGSRWFGQCLKKNVFFYGGLALDCKQEDFSGANKRWKNLFGDGKSKRVHWWQFILDEYINRNWPSRLQIRILSKATVLNVGCLDGVGGFLGHYLLSWIVALFWKQLNSKIAKNKISKEKIKTSKEEGDEEEAGRQNKEAKKQQKKGNWNPIKKWLWWWWMLNIMILLLRIRV